MIRRTTLAFAIIEKQVIFTTRVNFVIPKSLGPPIVITIRGLQPFHISVLSVYLTLAAC